MPVTDDFELIETKIAAPREGQFLVRNLLISGDPYMRQRLSNDLVKIGSALDGRAVGEVVESGDTAVLVGTLVRLKPGFREFSLCSAVTAERLDIQDESPDTHLGALGMTGLTKYAGMLIVAALKEANSTGCAGHKLQSDYQYSQGEFLAG